MVLAQTAQSEPEVGFCHLPKRGSFPVYCPAGFDLSVIDIVYLSWNRISGLGSTSAKTLQISDNFDLFAVAAFK